MASDPRTRTQSPIVTGTSVLAIKYADGVMVLADTLGSYGSMAMFTSMNRFKEVNPTTFVGCSGDLSDFQYLSDQLTELSINDFTADDGHQLSPSEIYNYIHRFLYQRRINMDPLWNSVVVAGFDKQKASAAPTGGEEQKGNNGATATGGAFLGYVDLNGTHYMDNYVTTGYGQYLALPILRKGWREGMNEAEARQLLEDAMRVLFYRDCRTINKFNIGKVTKDGVAFNWFTGGEYYSLDTYWSYKRFQFPNLSKDNQITAEEKKENDSKMDTK